MYVFVTVCVHPFLCVYVYLGLFLSILSCECVLLSRPTYYMCKCMKGEKRIDVLRKTKKVV